MPTPGRAVIECHMPVGFEDPFCRSCGAQDVARGKWLGVWRTCRWGWGGGPATWCCTCGASPAGAARGEAGHLGPGPAMGASDPPGGATNTLVVVIDMTLVRDQPVRLACWTWPRAVPRRSSGPGWPPEARGGSRKVTTWRIPGIRNAAGEELLAAWAVMDLALATGKVDERHTPVEVAWSVYQRLIQAYRAQNRAWAGS